MLPSGSTRDALYRYCTEWNTLEVFGDQHRLTLLVSAGLIVSVPWLARRYLNGRQQQMLGSTIGWTAMTGYTAWALLHAVAGSFDPSLHLPMHLCYFVGVITPLFMTYRLFACFEFVYYCAFSGVLQACVSPADVATYPHFDFFRFWLLHTGVLLSVVYAIAVYGMWPTWRGIVTTWLWVFVFLLVAIPVNLLLNANYLYICHKPPLSLLNYMGPWPWYVAVGCVMALFHFALAYVPIWFVKQVFVQRVTSPTATGG